MKNVYRFKQSLKKTFGKTESRHDEDYQIASNRYEMSHKCSSNYVKHVNQLVENFHAMSATLHFLADDLQDAYQNTGDENKPKKFEQIAEKIESQCVIPFQNATKSDIIENVQQYSAQFSNVKEFDSKRKKILLEYEYHKDRVKKLSEKQAKNPMDLPKAKELMKAAKEEFEKYDHHVKKNYNELYNQRPHVFDPSVINLIGELNAYFSNVSSIMKELNEVAQQGRFASPVVQEEYTLGSLGDDLSDLSLQSTSAVPPEFNCDWFYLEEGSLQQTGPLSFQQLKSKYHSGELNGETYVFFTGVTDWKQIKTLGKLQNALN